MFWRRRKLPEDGEPLVPHGLIWQATEDQGSTELPPDMWDNSPKEVTCSPAEPAEMPVRRPAPVQTHSQSVQAAPDSGELPPPKKWPRVDDAEIARRAQLVDTAVSFPYRKPLIGAVVPKPIEPAFQQEREQPARLELVSISQSTALRAARSEQFNNWVSRLRSLKFPDVSFILRRVRSLKILARMKNGVSSSVQATTRGVNALRLKSDPALDAAKLRWLHGSKAVLSQFRVSTQRVRENIRAIDMSSPARIWQRAHTLRVRIRIPASNWRFITTIPGNAKASELHVQNPLRRDSRPWASLAMGGLSALLALGVISALRHYGTGRELLQPAQETVNAAAPSPTTPQHSQPVISKEAATGKSTPIPRGSQEHDHVGRRLTPPEVQKRTTASPSASNPRVRHNRDEDDYVAADTYVYYGMGGKPKR